MGVKQGRSNCVEELALTYFACYYMLLLTTMFAMSPSKFGRPSWSLVSRGHQQSQNHIRLDSVASSLLPATTWLSFPTGTLDLFQNFSRFSLSRAPPSLLSSLPVGKNFEAVRLCMQEIFMRCCRGGGAAVVSGGNETTDFIEEEFFGEGLFKQGGKTT